MRPRSDNGREPMMTVKELADYLRVHPTTVYRLLRQGELPGLRIGSDWRFSRETIDQWIARSARPAPSTRADVQENGGGERLNHRVGRRHDRIDEL
jgi:excisionase family DNA binding protein